jgi:hypothetical protein
MIFIGACIGKRQMTAKSDESGKTTLETRHDTH